MTGLIWQNALEPWTMRCDVCGKTWDPPPARGKDHPTDASLDHAARKHWADCEGGRE